MGLAPEVGAGPQETPRPNWKPQGTSNIAVRTVDKDGMKRFLDLVNKADTEPDFLFDAEEFLDGLNEYADSYGLPKNAISDSLDMDESSPQRIVVKTDDKGKVIASIELEDYNGLWGVKGLARRKASGARSARAAVEILDHLYKEDPSFINKIDPGSMTIEGRNFVEKYVQKKLAEHEYTTVGSNWKPQGISNMPKAWHGTSAKIPDGKFRLPERDADGNYPSSGYAFADGIHVAEYGKGAKAHSRYYASMNAKGGDLYRVDVRLKPSDILDLSSGKVSPADLTKLEKVFPEVSEQISNLKSWQDINEVLGKLTRDDFKKAGYKAVRYMDEVEEGVGKGSGYSSVKALSVFDPDVIKTLSKSEVAPHSGYFDTSKWKPQGTSDAPSRRDFLKRITAASAGALIDPSSALKLANKAASGSPVAAANAVNVKSVVDYVYKKYGERATAVANALKNITTGTPAEIAALAKANHNPDLMTWIREATGNPKLKYTDMVESLIEVSKDPRFTDVRGILKMMADHPSPAVRQYLNKNYGGEAHLQKLIDSANGVKVEDAIGSDRAYMREAERRGWKEIEGRDPVQMGYPITTRKSSTTPGLDRDLYNEGVKAVDESLHELMGNPDRYGGGKRIAAYPAPKMIEGNRGLSTEYVKPLGRYMATYRDSTGKPQAQIIVDDNGKIQAVQVDSSLSRLTQDRAIKHVMDAAVDRFQANSVGYLKADEVGILDRFVAHALRRTAGPKIRKYYRIADKTVAELGVPKNLVRVEAYSRKFTVAGETMESGGDYNPNNRRIRVNAIHDMTPANVKRIVAHEGSHLKFDIATDSAEFTETLTRVFGQNSPPNNIGGVTEYSNAYWEEYRNNPNESNLVTAVNETLAEVGALRAISPDFHKVNWKAEAHKALIELNKAESHQQPLEMIAELNGHVNWTMWNILYDKMSEVYTKSANKGRRVK